MTTHGARWPTLALAAIVLLLGNGALAQGPAAPADTGTAASPQDAGAAPPTPSPASPQASQAPQPSAPPGPGRARRLANRDRPRK